MQFYTQSAGDAVDGLSASPRLTIGSGGNSHFYADVNVHALLVQNNQGDGLCLDLFASASDDHSDDAILRARTDAATLFEVFNNGDAFIDGNITHDGKITTKITTNGTGHDFVLHADPSYVNSIHSEFDGGAPLTFMDFRIANRS